MNRFRIYLVCLFILSAAASSAQVCNCPPDSQCKPCSGGYTSVTLRYNGLIPALVLVVDGSNNLANLTMSTGEEYTIYGSKRNEKFAEKQVSVLVNGLPNTLISPFCTELNVGASYGAFTVVGAVSMGGSTVCCITPPPDITPPQIQNVPASINAGVTSSCSTVVVWDEPIASDNCQLQALTSSHKPGDVFPLGTTIVTYTATDAEGLTATASFNVIVSDQTPPLFTTAPGDVNVAVNNSCVATASWIEPVASDNCQLKSITSSHKPGDSFPLGTTVVTYTATDDVGLSTTTSFYVTVSDLHPPVFSGVPEGDIIREADESCSAIVSWTEPQVTDECSVVVTQTHKPNDRFPLGKTIVQYDAKDLSGNISTIRFNVIVEDRAAPVFDFFPNNITVTAESQCSAIVNWNLPTASDRCSDVTISSTHQPNSTFATGVTKVKYTATDAFGNKTERELTITVEDKRKLEVTNCPGDILITSEEEEAFTKIDWIQPSHTSVCTEVTLTSNYQPGDVFPIGATEVEYVASSGSGEKAYCTFTVRIVVVEKPLLVAKLLTPDGDGNNDEWILSNISNYRDNKVQVFDRWGGLIFEASRYDNESVVWRGTNKSGASAPTGTYFYLIVASDGKRRLQESGSVELVR